MKRIDPVTDWNDVPVVVDIAMASRILGLNIARTRQLCIDGKLTATKPGGRVWRITKENLQNFVEEGA